jgi:Domain of unknown function (DUF4365)
MKRNWEEFFAERAEDLAFLHLTRRGDFVVNRLVSPDAGVDFLVTVTRDGVPTGRVFGVQVKAREGSVQSAGELNRLMKRPQVRSVADVPFPLCMFVFTMSDDRGYFGWLKEPVVGSRRSTSLRTPEHLVWGELDPDGMTEIVHTIESWYEARNRSPRPSSMRQEHHSQAA